MILKKKEKKKDCSVKISWEGSIYLKCTVCEVTSERGKANKIIIIADKYS